MDSFRLRFVREPLTRSMLAEIATEGFDSMINVRPAQGNRSRGVDDEAIRESIRIVVSALVQAT